MTMNYKTPAAHSSLVGGSTAARRIGCPRSYALEQLVPEPVDDGSVYAHEGTALHEIMAIALAEDREPADMLPFTYKSQDAGWEFTVTHSLWDEKGEPALTAFDTFIAAEEARIGSRARFLIETRVEFPGIPGAFGTADIVAQIGKEVFVLDWKFGNGIVPAEENKQIMFYAQAALDTHADWFEGIDYDNDDAPVTLVILQPAREGCIDVWRTNLGRLYAFETELLLAIDEIQSAGDKARIHDGPWCRFARCKMACPFHAGAANRLVEKFDVLKKAAEGGSLRPNDWGRRYADLLELADIVEPYLKEIRNMAHRVAESGLEIPGYVLEQKRCGARKWGVDEDEVRTFLRAHLDEDQYVTKRIISLPAAEKLLRVKGVDIPEDYMHVPEPAGTKLVRAEKSKAPAEDVSVTLKRLSNQLWRG